MYDYDTISLKRALTLYIKLQDLGSSGYMVLMRVRNKKIAINNKVWAREQIFFVACFYQFGEVCESVWLKNTILCPFLPPKLLILRVLGETNIWFLS